VAQFDENLKMLQKALVYNHYICTALKVSKMKIQIYRKGRDLQDQLSTSEE